jgi:hypothetical protein
MRSRTSMFMLVPIASLAVLPLAPLTGCEEKKAPAPTPVPAPAPAKPSEPATKATDHGHDHAADGSHAKPGASAPGHGGGVVELGSAAFGPFNAKATRDKGDVVAGKDAAFDVTITPKDGAGVKATSVRFWIGTQDAKGSVKAKAEIEDPKDPNRWHTHAEVPNPIPANSKLWFEIEDDKSGKHVGSFELKM